MTQLPLQHTKKSLFDSFPFATLSSPKWQDHGTSSSLACEVPRWNLSQKENQASLFTMKCFNVWKRSISAWFGSISCSPCPLLWLFCIWDSSISLQANLFVFFWSQALKLQHPVPTLPFAAATFLLPSRSILYLYLSRVYQLYYFSCHLLVNSAHFPPASNYSFFVDITTSDACYHRKLPPILK